MLARVIVYRDVVFEHVEYSTHSNQSGDPSDVQLMRGTAATKNRLLVLGCPVQLNRILAAEAALVPGHDVPLNVSIEVDLVLQSRMRMENLSVRLNGDDHMRLASPVLVDQVVRLNQDAQPSREWHKQALYICNIGPPMPCYTISVLLKHPLHTLDLVAAGVPY